MIKVNDINKAILIVSVGTTHEDTRKLTIDKIEERVKEKFKDYEIRRAFTSQKIINILREREGIDIDNPADAFEKLMQEGFHEVVVQPLHFVSGKEYEIIKRIAKNYKNSFQKLRLGRPILFFKGEEGLPDDYKIFIETIEEIIPKEGLTIFMGHGNHCIENQWYSYLQSAFQNKGYKNVYLANLKGSPTLNNVISKIKTEHGRGNEVTLIPLMLSAGDHAKNDMAGEKQDSWKNILLNEGFKVNIHLHGLGEIHKFKDIYLKHIDDLIENNNRA